MKHLKITIILFILFSSCLVNAGDIIDFESNLDDWDAIDIKLKSDNIIYDLPYKELNNKFDLKLNIYYPFFSVEERYPVIIFIHGGSFIIGDKSDINRFTSILNSLLKKGWAVVSIDYRLINHNTLFPDNLDDVKSAVDWVYNNAEKYEFNKDKIGLWGSSAGGNLALMTALTYQREGTISVDTKDIVNEIDPPIDFVISFAGPTDFLSKNLSIQKKITSFVIGEEINEKLLKEASPLYFIKKNMPPVLIIHGKNDIIVPYEQSKVFYKKIKEFNKECELISLDSGHTINPTFYSAVKDIREEIIEFIERYF